MPTAGHDAGALVRQRRGENDDDVRARTGYHPPGKEITWGELHVGSRPVFDGAGFAEVPHPTSRRFLMRPDF